MKTPKSRYRIYCLTFDHHSDNIDEIFDLKEKFFRQSLSEPGLPPALVFDTKTGKIVDKPLINLTKMEESS